MEESRTVRIAAQIVIGILFVIALTSLIGQFSIALQPLSTFFGWALPNSGASGSSSFGLRTASATLLTIIVYTLALMVVAVYKFARIDLTTPEEWEKTIDSMGSFIKTTNRHFALPVFFIMRPIIQYLQNPASHVIWVFGAITAAELVFSHYAPPPTGHTFQKTSWQRGLLYISLMVAGLGIFFKAITWYPHHSNLIQWACSAIFIAYFAVQYFIARKRSA